MKLSNRWKIIGALFPVLGSLAQHPIVSAGRGGLADGASTNGLFLPTLQIASAQRLHTGGAVPTNQFGVYHFRDIGYGSIPLLGTETQNLTSAGMTLMGWVKWPTFNVGSYKTNGFAGLIVKDRGGSAPLNRCWSFATLNTAAGVPYSISMSVFTNGSNLRIGGSSYSYTFPSNQWVHLAATYNGTLTSNNLGIAFYVDGVQLAVSNVSTAASIGSYPTGAQTRITLGHYDTVAGAAVSYGFVGQMYGWLVYPYVLSSNRIAWTRSRELNEVLAR